MKVRRATRRLRRLALIAAAATAAVPAGAGAHPDPPDTRPQRTADLAVGVSGTPVLVQSGGVAEFTIGVRNGGPRHARRVRLSVALSGSSHVESAEGAGWSCRITGTLVECARRGLRRDGATSVLIRAVARSGFGELSAGAAVGSHMSDPNPTDNTGIGAVAINNPPDLTDDSATTDAGVDVAIPVIDNDFDPDGDLLAFTGHTQGRHGSVQCEDLDCTYTPASGFTGSDTFEYTVSDGRGATAGASVDVTVKPPPPPAPPPPPPPAPQPEPATPPPDNANPHAVVSGPGSVGAGGTSGFTIVVSNGCSVAAANVVVRITLPAGATVVSRPRGAVRRGRVLTVPIGTLRQGAPRGLGLRLRFGPTGGGVRTLVAAVRSSNGRLAGDGIVIRVR